MERRSAAHGADAAPVIVYLGLGSNLGDRAGNLRRATEELTSLIDIDAASDVYESEPWGWTEQPRFLNMVVRGRTQLAPVELLRAAKDIEQRLGRTTTVRMGPRIIDIDVLLYGSITLERADLSIPHPGIRERAFVLIPLLDLDPDLVHPGSGVPLAASLEPLRAAAAALTRLGPLGFAERGNAPA